MSGLSAAHNNGVSVSHVYTLCEQLLDGTGASLKNIVFFFLIQNFLIFGFFYALKTKVNKNILCCMSQNILQMILKNNFYLTTCSKYFKNKGYMDRKPICGFKTHNLESKQSNSHQPTFKWLKNSMN